jgi:RNA recognition motif-containing protein
MTPNMLKKIEELYKDPKNREKALSLLKQIEDQMEGQEEEEATDDNEKETKGDDNVSDDDKQEEDDDDDDKMYSLLSISNKYQTIEEEIQNGNNETEKQENTVVSITNLPDGMEEEQLKEFFEQISPVVACRLLRNSKTGKSQGMAFVRFTDEQIAQMICHELDYYLIENKVLRVRMSTIPVSKHDQLFKDSSISYLRHLAMSDVKKRKQQRKFLKSLNKKPLSKQLSKAMIDHANNRLIKKQEKWTKKGINFDVSTLLNSNNNNCVSNEPEEQRKQQQQKAPNKPSSKKKLKRKQ